MGAKYSLICIFICILMSACTCNSGFDDYRYNPFQFPYPEYYLKAVQLNEITVDKKLDISEQFDIFGVDVKIANAFFDQVIKNKNFKSPFVLKKSGKPVLLANYHMENLMGCNSQKSTDAHKDFCSAFESSKEFNTKIFSLTPNDIQNQNGLNDGDLWLIHKKGLIFKQTQKIYIYNLDNLTAFRQDLQKNASGKIQLHIFPNKISPDSIEIILFDKDEALINMILSSMNLN